MTSSEIAAFNAGIRHASDMALLAALTIELRSDADQVRQRAAVEALRGLAEGLKASIPNGPNNAHEAAGSHQISSKTDPAGLA